MLVTFFNFFVTAKKRLGSLICLTLSSFALVACAADLSPLERVSQVTQQRYGAAAVSTTQAWYNLINQTKKEHELRKLKSVNDFFNRKLRFDSDMNIWGKTDYWSTPIESLVRQAGDCEDFAIAKYFTLRFADVPTSKLRITYVRARMGGASSNILQAHMVLAYYDTPNAEPLLLDNLYTEILPASRRSDLIPVFSFNGDGYWQSNNQPGKNNISKWAEFSERMKDESFE